MLSLVLVLFLKFSFASDSADKQFIAVWDKFLQCQKYEDVDKLVNCAEPLMDAKLVRMEKTKLLEFLSLDFTTSPLRTCTPKDETQPVRALAKNQKALCFDLLGNKFKSQGYILFETKKNPRISAIKYSL